MASSDNVYQYSSPSYHMYNFNPLPIAPIDRSSSSAYMDCQDHEDFEAEYDVYDDNLESSPSKTLTTVAVKVINPEKKSESKLFMLRNVGIDKLDSLSEVKHMIFDHFGGKIVSADLKFDVVYFRGNKCVCLLNADDMNDVKKLFRSSDGHNVTLWCMGCSRKRKGKCAIVLDPDGTDSECEYPAKRPKKK